MVQGLINNKEKTITLARLKPLMYQTEIPIWMELKEKVLQKNILLNLIRQTDAIQ